MADILTAEQQAAVENRGRSLLVSAAAGSGKTKVLVERLFSYVEGGEANLDDFLIITYTRAAAAELRGKIAKVLGEKLQENPLNAHLQRQLLRVYRADIKTVDAFCTALLRENCHLLREDARGHALRPDFRVLDENEAQLLRERVLARTLDEFYETMREGDGASLLADTLGAGRDDRALGALVLELHGKLQAQPYMDRWLASQEQLWHDLPPRVEDTVYGTLLLSMVRRKALHCAALLRGAAEEMTSDAALADKYAPLFLGVAEQFALLAASAEEDWDAAAKRRVDFPLFLPIRHHPAFTRTRQPYAPTNPYRQKHTSHRSSPTENHPATPYRHRHRLPNPPHPLFYFPIGDFLPGIEPPGIFHKSLPFSRPACPGFHFLPFLPGSFSHHYFFDFIYFHTSSLTVFISKTTLHKNRGQEKAYFF